MTNNRHSSSNMVQYISTTFRFVIITSLPIGPTTNTLNARMGSYRNCTYLGQWKLQCAQRTPQRKYDNTADTNVMMAELKR
ncbi:unnamed protein product [Absidia cylindrospora]